MPIRPLARPFAVAALLSLLLASPSPADEEIGGRFLYRVVEGSPAHRDSLSALIKGRRDVPNWVRNMLSRNAYVALASTREQVGDRAMERFMACQARKCGESQVRVLFSADGRHAVMRVTDAALGEVLLGEPDEAERAVLLRPDA